MPEVAPKVEIKPGDAKQKRVRAASVMDKNIPKISDTIVQPAKPDEEDKKREGTRVSPLPEESKESLKLPSSNSDLVFDGLEYVNLVNERDSFAYFRLHDRNPLTQRKFLFALNQRYLQTKENPASNPVMQNSQIRPERSTKKMNLSGKLNAFLRNKKSRKTRAGLFHMIALSIQDLKPKAATALIETLPESSLAKKRHADTNRIFLRAMSARMESICLQMYEKGFPASPSLPIFGTISAEKFAFPSYFQLAVALEMVDLVRGMIKVYIIDQKVDVNLSWYQLSPIHNACVAGNEKLMAILVENGANVNQGLGLEDMYLLSKLKMNSPQNILDDKADSNSKIVQNNISESHRDIFRQPGYKGPINVGADYTRELIIFPFELAYVKGHFKLAVSLLEQYYGLISTNPKIVEIAFFGLLHSKDYKWTKKLIQLKAKINGRDSFGSNALHLACRAGNLNIVIVLINEKMHINEPGFRGWTPLHEAASGGHVDVVQYLIYKGANLDAQNEAGETPKHLATTRSIDAATIKLMFSKDGSKEASMLEIEDKVLKAEPFPSPPPGSVSPKEGRAKKGLASGIGGLFSSSKSLTSSTSSSTSLVSKPPPTEKDKGRRSFFSSSKSKSSTQNL